MKIWQCLNENKKWKNLLLSVAFYVLCILAIPIMEQIVPSGVCNPGLGITFLFFFLPIIVVVLLVINLILVCTYRKEHLYSLWLHVLVLISGLILVKFFIE